MADTSNDDSPGIATRDLHPQHLTCPHCGTDLFRVDHAPQYDDVLLYCTECSRRAEVAFDDPIYRALVTDAGAESDVTSVITAVEQRLRPCLCGGRFHADAPRRCSECEGAVISVIAGEPAVDLWPGYCDVDMERRMPAPEDVERINAFDASHIRRTDLWQR